jgi:hypothetical protein
MAKESLSLPSFCLVAADKRLLRAAQAEGLTAFDPAQAAPADIPALLAALVPGN